MRMMGDMLLALFMFCDKTQIRKKITQQAQLNLLRQNIMDRSKHFTAKPEIK